MKVLPSMALASVLLHLSAIDVLAMPEIFRQADLKQGERLIAENGCAACHAKKVGGDGSGIYRPTGRVSSPGLLRGMVEECNLNLKLGLFPEEVTDIAAVLNRDYYRFKQ